jgi:hypothetical protein
MNVTKLKTQAVKAKRIVTTPDFWNAKSRDSSEPNQAGGIRRERTQSTARTAAINEEVRWSVPE